MNTAYSWSHSVYKVTQMTINVDIQLYHLFPVTITTEIYFKVYPTHQFLLILSQLPVSNHICPFVPAAFLNKLVY